MDTETQPKPYLSARGLHHLHPAVRAVVVPCPRCQTPISVPVGATHIGCERCDWHGRVRRTEVKPA